MTALKGKQGRWSGISLFERDETMSNKQINSQSAPAAVGPYSHSVLAGNTLYVSGQLGLDPVTGELKTDISTQTVQALDNLGSILTAAGMSYTDVVKTTIFLTDMSDFATVNDIYGTYFSEALPARSCIQVCELPKGGLVEVEAVAVK